MLSENPNQSPSSPPKIKRRLRKMEEEKELPEEIKLHILSFVDFTNVIHVSAVSKPWSSAAAALQCLNFTNVDDDTSRKSDDYLKRSTEKVVSMMDSAISFILKSKSTEGSHIQKLRFKLHGGFSHPSISERIGSIASLTYQNLREFEFYHGHFDGGINYFSGSVFASSSLHKLVLEELVLSSSNVSRHEIDLPSLRELYLRRNILIDAKFLEQLIMNSSHLEILEIFSCSDHALKIGPHRKLKRVIIEYFPPVRFAETPNLEYFRYRCNYSKSLLEESHVRDVAQSLKVLELIYPCHKVNLMNSIERLLSCLGVLEVFKFKWTYDRNDRLTERLRISSSTLRELCLHFHNPVKVQVLNAPRLSKFYHRGFTLSHLSFEASSVIKEAIFVQRNIYDLVHLSNAQLVGLFRNFNHCETMKLEDFMYNELIVEKKVRKCIRVTPLLGNMKHLTFGARNVGYFYINRFSNPINLDLLESILWMAPRLQTLTFVERDKPARTFQYIFENSNHVDAGEEVPLVSRRKKNSIKVKVETCSRNGAKGLELKKYSFDDTEKLGEVEIKRWKFWTMWDCGDDK